MEERLDSSSNFENANVETPRAMKKHLPAPAGTMANPTHTHHLPEVSVRSDFLERVLRYIDSKPPQHLLWTAIEHEQRNVLQGLAGTIYVA